MAADTIAGFEKLGGFQQNKQKEMLEGIPLSRFGSKWDIAMACIYLSSRSPIMLMLLPLLLLLLLTQAQWSSPLENVNHLARLASTFKVGSVLHVQTAPITACHILIDSPLELVPSSGCCPSCCCVSERQAGINLSHMLTAQPIGITRLLLLKQTLPLLAMHCHLYMTSALCITSDVSLQS